MRFTSVRKSQCCAFPAWTLFAYGRRKSIKKIQKRNFKDLCFYIFQPTSLSMKKPNKVTSTLIKWKYFLNVFQEGIIYQFDMLRILCLSVYLCSVLSHLKCYQKKQATMMRKRGLMTNRPYGVFQLKYKQPCLPICFDS